MNFDIIIYFIFFIPLFWVMVFDQQKLKNKNVFLKHLLISIGVLVAGILYNHYFAKENKSFAYFGSQMTLIFLILYKLIRIPYYMIYNVIG